MKRAGSEQRNATAWPKSSAEPTKPAGMRLARSSRFAPSEVTRFEERLLADVRAKHGDLLDSIRTEGAISDEVEEKLKALMVGFAKSYA